MSSGSLSGSLLCLILVGIELISSDYPLDLPGGDLLRIFVLIDDLQLLLAIVRISLSQAPYPLFLDEGHFPVPLTMGSSRPISQAMDIVF